MVAVCMNVWITKNLVWLFLFPGSRVLWRKVECVVYGLASWSWYGAIAGNCICTFLYWQRVCDDVCLLIVDFNFNCCCVTSGVGNWGRPGTFTCGRWTYRLVSTAWPVKVKVKVSICIAHLAYNASNALSSLTRAASRTATTCSLQTQANAAAG